MSNESSPKPPERRGAEAHAATMAADASQLPPGPGVTLAGRYLIERLLGRGGMGAVWAAVDRQLGERVAIKTLDGAAASPMIERFRREVRLARRVTHRNVARIFDIGEHGSTFFLSMELVEGTSLAELIAARGRLELAAAIDIGRQIADGLAAAHAAGVVHRDLKPGNVLVTAGATPRVALTDFGIAFGVVDDVRLTVDGNGLLGTPAYMAPEQVRGGTVDARSDLYALGLVLYETVTGTLPFTGETPLQLAIARLDRDPIDPREHVAVPDALAELLLQCLRSDPAQRPSSAEAIAAALLAVDATAPVLASTGALPRAHVPSTSSRTEAGTLARMTSAATLAVLPLRYRGPADEAYLAETLTDELVDLLSATRGLKVMASGATAKYAGDRDPFTVGRELGVDIVVDGTVQRSGSSLRIAARLVDVASGFQTWSGRFDGALADVFELQDRIAKQITETLRVELETDRHRGDAPPEAIELYLRARAKMRQVARDVEAIDAIIPMYDECLALAPSFGPALAGRASACLRAWFRPEQGDRVGERERLARDAVAAAAAGAPMLAETQLALARLAVQDGRYRDAASAIGDALRIAPTYPEAHEYAGSLMCEAGRPERGMTHLKLASELDPGSGLGLLVLARHQALQGDRVRAEQALAQLAASDGGGVPVYGLMVTMLRVAAWFGDDAGVLEIAERSRTLDDGGIVFSSLRRAYLGEISAAEAFARAGQGLSGANPRFRTLIYQVATEAMCRQHDLDGAWGALELAADDVLVDLHWLDRCPLLQGLRSRSGYGELRERVKQRAEAIWHVG